MAGGAAGAGDGVHLDAAGGKLVPALRTATAAASGSGGRHGLAAAGATAAAAISSPFTAAGGVGALGVWRPRAAPCAAAPLLVGDWLVRVVIV